MKPKARRDNLLVEKLDDETIVYDLDADKAHLMNKTAALVWERCDGNVSIAELNETIGAKTGLPADEEVVHLALRQLSHAGLLEDGAVPAGPSMLSRRQLMHRLGLGASLAVMLPIVTSVVAPTPAFAQSVGGNGPGGNGPGGGDGDITPDIGTPTIPPPI